MAELILIIEASSGLSTRLWVLIPERKKTYPSAGANSVHVTLNSDEVGSCF